MPYLQENKKKRVHKSIGQKGISKKANREFKKYWKNSNQRLLLRRIMSTVNSRFKRSRDLSDKFKSPK